MEELIKILESVKPGVDYMSETSLIDEEILDSLDIVTIVAKINQEFDIEFPVNEIVPENLILQKLYMQQLQDYKTNNRIEGKKSVIYIN